MELVKYVWGHWLVTLALVFAGIYAAYYLYVRLEANEPNKKPVKWVLISLAVSIAIAVANYYLTKSAPEVKLPI